MANTADALPTLYRLGANGTIYQWRVWVERHSSTHGMLVTESGPKGGRLRVAERRVAASTRMDPMARAHHQAMKAWTDQKAKKGYTDNWPYRSGSRAGAEWRSVEISKRTHAAPAAVASNNGVATPHGGYTGPLPMLAKAVTLLPYDAGVKGMTFPLLAQPKVDGFRCVVRVVPDSGGDDGVVLTSRTGAVFKGFNRFKVALGRALRVPVGVAPEHFYLDGELVVNGVADFSALSSELKRGQNRAEHECDALRLKAFDCFTRDQPNAPFTQRLAWLREACGAGGDGRCDGLVDVLDTFEVQDVAAVRALLAQWLDVGYEGIILRAPAAAYRFNGRGNDLQKYKVMHDAEFRIVGYREGEGMARGCVVWECATESGARFWVNPRATRDAKAAMLLVADRHIGQYLTVQYQELTADGIPRFPVGKAIRSPKDNEDVAKRLANDPAPPAMKRAAGKS